MGTNYYVAKNHCGCCDRYDTEYHIGKASLGWSFSFHGYPAERLTSWGAWKQFLKDCDIRDEYGARVSYDYFVHMIEREKSPEFVRADGHRNLQHNEEGRRAQFPYFDERYDWDDDQGYAFTTREFC